MVSPKRIPLDAPLERRHGVKLVNESALGIYQMTWKSGPDRRRCVLSWYDSLGKPRFEFYVPATGRMTPPIPVADGHLETLGWAEPRHVAQFKTFAPRYADLMETAWEEGS